MMKNKNELSEEQKRILINKGTEPPFSGKYNLHFEDGVYKCAGCDEPLFESDMKFESNCGWPSFDESIKGKISYKKDRSLGIIRTEILCANCGVHLGHIFDDGPTDTGQRYCVNSLSLQFKKDDEN
jgi:peptide-methionine (R)-S-oxide reductase